MKMQHYIFSQYNVSCVSFSLMLKTVPSSILYSSSFVVFHTVSFKVAWLYKLKIYPNEFERKLILVVSYKIDRSAYVQKNLVHYRIWI